MTLKSAAQLTHSFAAEASGLCYAASPGLGSWAAGMSFSSDFCRHLFIH